MQYPRHINTANSLRACKCGFFGPVARRTARCPHCSERLPRMTKGHRELLRMKAADAGIPYGGC